MSKKYLRHPACAAWPDLSNEELESLADDIELNGLKVPIDLMPDGKTIIDGWNRYTACVLKGVTPKFRTLPKNTDPVLHSISMNECRRHLTTSQRAMVAAKMPCRPEGRTPKKILEQPRKFAELPDSTLEIAAKMDVSPRMVTYSREILEANPDLAEEVTAGEKTVNEAVKEVRAEKAAEKPAEPAKDLHGDKLPKAVAEIFNRTAEMKVYQNKLNLIRREIDAKCREKDILWKYVHAQHVCADLKNAADALGNAMPYCLCPACAGDKCKHCRQTGYVNKMTYDITPKGLKRGDDR